jgi:PH (Pleckstrin Homology) domain-containing protein
MAITREEIEREKKTLPFGWGRFGKAYDQLSEISEPDESLLAASVALSPEYHQGGRFVPGTVASAVSELRKTTNVLVACTDQRLIMLSTGVAGGARDHVSIPYEGMEIVERARRYFVIGIPAGRVKIRGMAKQQQPRFLEVLEGQARPASTEPA